jgi:succinate-semialdehyde dehydrogenase/glutarate-semialdehyde dehydrogenase
MPLFLLNAGLTDLCRSANRIFVQTSIAEIFVEKLTAAVKKLSTGPSLDSNTTQGPLVNEAAVRKVQEHVNDAVAKGAKVEIGGTRLPGAGYFFEPTVISGATSEMIVASEETFGPLAPVFTFENEEDVLKMANDTEFGLAGYFFSTNIGRCMRMARKLQVGMVGVNTGKISAAEAPFGGIKDSGYGREGSVYGLEEYQFVKSVTIGNHDK